MTNFLFSIHGDIATSILTNGQTLIIDAQDIPLVKSHAWQIDKDGYLARSRRNPIGTVFLHREILGIRDRKIIVDHRNRNRMDCRRCNLRTATPTQNAANHGPFKTNKTGYTGVYFSRSSGRYEVKVGYRGRRIKLGSSKNDLITLAQMYNIGASFFFGDFAGAMNPVPPPPEELVKTVLEKCRKYEKAPDCTGATIA